MALLKELGVEWEFEVVRIDPVLVADAPISSTRIREAIASGDFSESSACLGRPFLLTGKVVSGAGLGATLGFPTANLGIDGMQLPPNGVYAVSVHREGRVYPGVANIGVRPTVDPTCSKRTVEVHLFDWSEDLVGKELSLEFVKFLRGEEKFSDLEALKGQIAKDCEWARAILN